MAANLGIGLDIGTTSIKVAVLANKDTPPKLISLGRVASPQPGIISESDLDLEAVAQSIKNLFAETGINSKEVTIGLPESRIFTRVIYDLPYLSDSELSQAIKYAAEEFIPMPMQDVNLNYQILFRSEAKGPKSRTIVFVVAAPKILVDKYLKVLQMAELKVIAIETEMIAISRAVMGTMADSPTTLLIQMGASTTDFAIISDGLILLTRSISTGGIALTRTVAQAFNFELVQAEEYKKVYGLLEEQLEGKLFQALKPIMDVIVTEARRVIQSYETQNYQKPVKRLILTGGTSGLPGIVKYFTDNLGLEVQEADPWVNVATDPSIRTKLASEGSLYSAAVGLAMRKDT